MVEHTRTIGFTTAYAIGLGTMIAAGIFSLSGTAVLRIGSTAVVAFVLAALVAGVTAAAYSEFASIYAENGGGYLFTSRTFEGRDRLKYGIGMALFLGYTGTTAFYLATMDEWFFGFVFPGLSGLLPHGTFGVLAALLLGVLNVRGTEESGAFQVIVTSAKVLVLLAFIGGMFASVGVGPAVGEFAASFQPEPVETVSVAALAFITFFGFSAIAASAGEIIEPRRTVPRAIAASIGTVTVLYAFVIVAMVNITNVADRLDRSPEAVLQLGERAMGAVSQAFIPVEVAGIQVGMALIVAGAIFSMVSASNASILAASGIGSLMGQQGHAPRRFSRIHPDYGTPFWSISTATAVIVALVVVFITLFGEHGVSGVHALGLGPLTGFATFNLLVPLAVVNAALVYSRRRFPDIERGFEMPLVPVLPVVGILANLGLVLNLPPVGVGVGVVVVLALLGAYLAWGGAPDVDELDRTVAPPSGAEAAADGAPGGSDVLVPVRRAERAPDYVRLADRLSALDDGDPTVKVLTVYPVRDQTPHETVEDAARARTDRIRDALDAADLDVEYVVEGHLCRDVGYAILRTARDDDVERILMGYPEDHRDVTESVEYGAPCDVVFVSDWAGADLSTVTVGAGAGPHHRALLPLVERLGESGSEVHVVNVAPSGAGGTPESLDDTIAALDLPSVQVHNVTASSVAEGLVDAAADHGGVLFIGATRDRRLRRWVLGSVPDRVIDLARAGDVPVLVYATDTGPSGTLEDVVYPVVRYIRRLRRFGTGIGDFDPTADASEAREE